MEKEQELAVVRNKPLSAQDIRKQVNLIQAVMKSVMKEGEHYGKIPGTKKNTLFKSGAEKLAMTFRLTPEFEELPGSCENDDVIVYKINCKLIHITTGFVVGNGRGTCNSKEKKYRTRSVYANKATEEEKAIGKLEHKTSATGSYDVYVIPQDPWDIQNTIYKMACKRSMVAGILNATAASDIFTQDIEDLPAGTVLEDDVINAKPQEKASMPSPLKKEQGVSSNGVIFSSLKQQQKIHIMAKELWGSQEGILYKKIGELHGLTVESTKDLTLTQANDIIRDMSKAIAAK